MGLGGFLVVVAVGAVGYLAWRGARRRLEEMRIKARRSKSDETRAVTLERDPDTGVYRQKERGP